MKNSAPKSTLFLIEIVIAILFFAISGVICVQIFAKAHTFSSETKQENYANAKLSTVAAYIKTENGQLKSIAEKMDGELSGERINFYYDKSWQDCAKAQATYGMTAKKLYGEQISVEIYETGTEKKILRQIISFHLPITLKEASK